MCVGYHIVHLIHCHGRLPLPGRGGQLGGGQGQPDIHVFFGLHELFVDHEELFGFCLLARLFGSHCSHLSNFPIVVFIIIT